MAVLQRRNNHNIVWIHRLVLKYYILIDNLIVKDGPLFIREGWAIFFGINFFFLPLGCA